MFFRRLNWNVVGWFRTVSAISYAIIALGIAMMIFNFVRTGAPLRLGLSFTGGTDVSAKFTRPITKDSLVAVGDFGNGAGLCIDTHQRCASLLLYDVEDRSSVGRPVETGAAAASRGGVVAEDGAAHVEVVVRREIPGLWVGSEVHDPQIGLGIGTDGLRN